MAVENRQWILGLSDVRTGLPQGRFFYISRGYQKKFLLLWVAKTGRGNALDCCLGYGGIFSCYVFTLLQGPIYTRPFSTYTWEGISRSPLRNLRCFYTIYKKHRRFLTSASGTGEQMLDIGVVGCKVRFTLGALFLYIQRTLEKIPPPLGCRNRAW